MHLRHLHLPGPIPYLRAASIQESLVARFLAHKAAPTLHPAPLPTVLTTQFQPVYTCGRREIGSTTPSQQTYLRATGAEFHEAQRGGQTTFHGPGQLIAYPVIDLKTHGLRPRDYVCLLEKSVIRTCKAFGVEAITTEHPGVWVDQDRKICALGIHLRRGVSGCGIGLNVSTDLGWFERIVACGLEGKRTTSLLDLRVERTVEEVGEVFVRELAGALGDVDGVEEVDLEDLGID